MPVANLSPEVKAAISKKAVVPIVGISSVGKNSVMDATAERYSDFHRVSGFTTRAQRPTEPNDTYRAYLPDSAGNIEALINGTGQDALIQYQVHPTTNDIYGTMLQDYAGSYNLKDVLSGAVDTFRGLGFAACNVIVLVAYPQEWQARFDGNGFEPKQAYARIQEGITSLTWAFDQKGEVSWLVNPDGKLQTSAESIRQLALGRENPAQESHARKIGAQLLNHLRIIQ